MTDNTCVVYVEPGKVSVEKIEYPKLELPPGVPGRNRLCEHGVILRIVATNRCGSDLHTVRGRTTAPRGQTLGHEITDEIIELGSDVEFLEKGDLVSVPFNIACGRCRMCKAGHTGVCLNVNPARPGAAYGYVDMGGWIGGQAKYVMVPYADFNVLKVPDRDQQGFRLLPLCLCKLKRSQLSSRKEEHARPLLDPQWREWSETLTQVQQMGNLFPGGLS